MKKVNKNPGFSKKDTRALRAVQQFSCIGGDCEDTCCKDWVVSLNKQDYITWRSAARKQPKEQALFEKNVKKSNDRFYATIHHSAQTGRCPFHREDGFCGVQANLGAAALPGICRTYPRNYYWEKTSARVNGTMACPEYVRLLMAREDATDLIATSAPPANESMGVSPSMGQHWNWQRCLSELIELGLAVLKEPSPKSSLAERLFVLAMMMQRIDQMGDDPNNPIALPAVSQAVLPYAGVETRESLFQQFRALELPDSDLTLQIVLSVYVYRLTKDLGTVPPLWDGIYASYSDLPAAQLKFTPGESLQVDVHTIAPRYRERRRQLHARAGQQLITWYQQFFCNQWCGSTATADESPLDYLARHLVTLHLIDFAVCSHQNADTLLEGQGPLSEQEHTLLAKHVVAMVYQFSRAVLHMQELKRSLANLLNEQQISQLALVTTLLKDLEASTGSGAFKINPLAAAMAR